MNVFKDKIKKMEKQVFRKKTFTLQTKGRVCEVEPATSITSADRAVDRMKTKWPRGTVKSHFELSLDQR